MNRYFKYYFLGLLLALPLGVFGQLNYQSGYIITLQNDTVNGLIDNGGDVRNTKVCLFKTDKSSKVTRYYPQDIKAYRFTDENYYQSMKVTEKGADKLVFLNVLLEGKVNLYYNLRSNYKAFYLQKDESELIGLLNKKARVPISRGLFHDEFQVYDLNQQDRNIAFVEIDLYKDTLASFFSNSDKIVNQIPNVSYNRKSLINITKAYIRETCKEPNCITYERNLNLYKPYFGVFVGYQLSSIYFWEDRFIGPGNKKSVVEASVESDVVSSIPFGVFYNVPITRISKNLSFQVELMANKTTYGWNAIRSDEADSITIKMRSVSLPMMLKYKIERPLLSPTIAVGKEFSYVYNSDVRRYRTDEEDGSIFYDNLMIHKTQKGGWFVELGLNYKLNPKLTVFSNLRFHANSNLIVSNEPSDTDYNRFSFNDIVDNQNHNHRFKSYHGTLFIGVNF